MDFTVSEKMKTILGMIDEFVDKELIPLEPEFLTKSGPKSAAGARGKTEDGQANGAVGTQPPAGIRRHGA